MRYPTVKLFKKHVKPFLSDFEKRPVDFADVFDACDYIEREWEKVMEASDLTYAFFASHDLVHKAAVMREMEMCDRMVWQVQSELIRQTQDVWVSSVYDAREVADKHKVEAVLSIEHPDAPEGGGKAPKFDGIMQHIACFWDTENPEYEDGPNEDNIGRALDFLELNRNKNILIHCKAGKSRSVALALAHMTKTRPPEEAIKIIKKMRPNAAPNLLVVDIADRLLGFDGKLTRAVEADEEFTRRREAIRNELKDLVYTRGLEKRL